MCPKNIWLCIIIYFVFSTPLFYQFEWIVLINALELQMRWFLKKIVQEFLCEMTSKSYVDTLMEWSKFIILLHTDYAFCIIIISLTMPICTGSTASVLNSYDMIALHIVLPLPCYTWCYYMSVVYITMCYSSVCLISKPLMMQCFIN